MYTTIFPEIKEINEQLQKFVIQYFNQYVDEKFFAAASSSSGKYHPADEICEGGLVLHTRKVCKVALSLLEAMPDHLNVPRIRDTIIVAALLHDSAKSGAKGNWGEHTVFEHPLIASRNMLNFVANANIDIESEELHEATRIWETASRLIETHMGKWSTSKYSNEVLPLPTLELQKLLHTADYLASRTFIDVEL